MGIRETGAIAIRKVVYADMLAAGCSEDIARMAAEKARAAFETGWSGAVENTCKWLEEKAILGYIEDEEVDKFIGIYRKAMKD